jgi:hypothetical protein
VKCHCTEQEGDVCPFVCVYVYIIIYIYIYIYISTAYSTHTGVLIVRYTFNCVEMWNCVLQHVHSERSLVAFHNLYVSIDPLPFEFENSLLS